MCAANEKSSLIGGIVKMKCPNCRTGKAFINDSVFPLGKSQQLIEYCSVCGQKMMHERNREMPKILPGMAWGWSSLL